MYSGLLLALFGLAALFVQGTVFHLLLPFDFAPNLVTILVVYLAFYRARPSGALLVFILGLELDILSGSRLLGVHSTSYLVAFIVLSILSQRLFLESFVTVFMAAAFGVFLDQIVYLIVARQFLEMHSSTGLAFYTLAFEAIFTAMAALILFPILKLLLRRWDRAATSGYYGL